MTFIYDTAGNAYRVDHVYKIFVDADNVHLGDYAVYGEVEGDSARAIFADTLTQANAQAKLAQIVNEFGGYDPRA